MFLEISDEIFQKIKPNLEAMQVSYEASDCTLPGETIRVVHLEISTPLSSEQVRILNDQLDALYGENTTERVQAKDKDGNGIPDIAEKDGEIKEVRRRKWDDQYHTPGKEFRGWFTGESTEEEVTHERV